MKDKKIRMATGERPDDQGHTIVGGRPEAGRSLRSDIPRGLEFLVKKAAVDPEFKREFLQKRDRLIDELNIPLDASEKAMLACVSPEHLEKMINATRVPPSQHKALAKASTAAMIALLTHLAFAPVPGRAETQEISPINNELFQNSGNNEYAVLLTGIRPDEDLEIVKKREKIEIPASEEDQGVTLLDDPVAPFDQITDENVAGLSVGEALQQLSDQTGVKVELNGLDQVVTDYRLESDSAGQTVAATMKKIFTELKGEDQIFKCNFDAEANTLSVEFVSRPMQALPPAPPMMKPPLVKPDFDDSAICRGIRSDMPELKIKKDFNDGEQK